MGLPRSTQNNALGIDSEGRFGGIIALNTCLWGGWGNEGCMQAM